MEVESESFWRRLEWSRVFWGLVISQQERQAQACPGNGVSGRGLLAGARRGKAGGRRRLVAGLGRGSLLGPLDVELEELELRPVQHGQVRTQLIRTQSAEEERRG
jgi:hypothetical protein